MTNEQIAQAARLICAAQADKQDNGDSQLYLSGSWDHTVWMRLVEEGIRKGIEIGMQCFIIPAPKPDPLVEIMEQCSTVDAEEGETYEDAMVRNIRAALDARGFEIREKHDDLQQFPETCIK